MTYAARGESTSAVEVTNISKHGFWLLIDENHLYWPELDIDLEVESVFHPERYPLTSRVHEGGERDGAAERDEEGGRDRIDDCVLALLQLTLHQGARAWKGFDYEVMDRLYRKGYILDPRNKIKSIVLTEEGLVRSERLFAELFGKR